MDDNERRADLLSKARDAEQRATTATIPEATQALARIAERYRELAKVTLSLTPGSS